MIESGILIHWGALHRLWYASLFFIAVAAVIWGYVTYRGRMKVLAHKDWAGLLLPFSCMWRVRMRTGLLITALISIFIALLQPQWGRKDEVVQQEGRDVLVLLDISRSMQAQDVRPSRLAFVKLKVRKLLQQLSFERVGLILFSGTAFLQCPLTADYQTFLLFLEQVTTEVISSGTTAISSAISQAVTVFARSKKRKNRLVLLITDGEDFASNMKQVVQQVKREKLTVISWGVGSDQGAPIPVVDEHGRPQGHVKDARGNVALTKLNEPLLRHISDELGGHYEYVSVDDGDITRIARYLDRFEKEQLEERLFNQYHDRYPLFLFIAWFCLMLEWII